MPAKKQQVNMGVVKVPDLSALTDEQLRQFAEDTMKSLLGSDEVDEDA